MKRSSSELSKSPATGAATLNLYTLIEDAPPSPPLHPAREQRPPLNEESAGRRAAELLNSVPPQQEAFAQLLDDMQEQGIQKFKLSGIRLSAAGYGVLVAEFEKPGRLSEHIHELDFSDTEFPQITTLLQAIDSQHGGQLRSLNFANVQFPRSRVKGQSDMSRVVGLQPNHLSLITKIVKDNEGMSYLNLNYQDLMGSTLARTNPGSSHRDAPVYRLVEACLKSRIEILKLQHCELSDLDLSDIRDMLHKSAQSGQTSLRELHLQGNDIGHAHDYAGFIQGLNAHPSLEYLGLPAMAHDRYKQLDKDQKLAVAQALQACPKLSKLEPAALANEPEIRAVLSTRQAELRQAQLTNAVLV